MTSIHTYGRGMRTQLVNAARSFARVHELYWARLEQLDADPAADALRWADGIGGPRLIGTYLPDEPRPDAG